MTRPHFRVSSDSDHVDHERRQRAHIYITNMIFCLYVLKIYKYAIAGERELNFHSTLLRSSKLINHTFIISY